ncbi:hypothetical protein BDR26DRAFT_871001 [Obelidium mucronatum]|nr:hypothetical protein BDR26DRAFT_871001 [Obelidium mucronatum]
MQTEDYSDAFSRKRVWTGPNKQVASMRSMGANYPTYISEVNASPGQHTMGHSGPIHGTSPRSMNSRIRGSTSNSVSLGVGPDRVFRRPTGGSLSVNFTNSVNSFYDLAQSLPPFPAGIQGMIMPLPPPTPQIKKNTYNYKNKSSGPNTPANPVANTTPSELAGSPDPGTIKSTAAVKKVGDESAKTRVKDKSSSSARLFKRPQLNASIITNWQSLYSDSWSGTRYWRNDFESEVSSDCTLLEDVLYALCVVRIIPLLSMLPTLALPRFLNTLALLLMTHHTVYIDPSTFLAQWGIISRFLFTPLRIVAVFGDGAASTAFLVFLVITRVSVFLQTIIAAVSDKRGGAGWVLLRRCSVMVWFPVVFMVVQGLVVVRWTGWRDVMWAAGTVGEIVAVCVVDSMEKRDCIWSLDLHGIDNGAKACKNDGYDEYDEQLAMKGCWNFNVRKRVMRMVPLLLGGIGALALWPIRIGVGQLDATTGIQFVIGPFVVSTFGIVLLYSVYWLYCLQQQPNSIERGYSTETFISNGNLSIMNNLQIQLPPAIFLTPAYSVLWRLLHIPIYSGIVIMGAGMKTILQDLLNQWLGLAGFQPIPPKNYLTQADTQNQSSLDYYLRITSESNKTFTPTEFVDIRSIGQLWDFTTPKVWMSTGIASILLFSNLAAFVASLSALKMHRFHQSRMIRHAKLDLRATQSILDNDCGVNTLVQEDSKLDELDEVTLHRKPSLYRTQSYRESSTRSTNAVNTASFNNRSSRQTFPVVTSSRNGVVNNTSTGAPIKTPTPSLLALGRSSSFRGSRTNVDESQITALENDDKFWRKLLESPHGSRENSIKSIGEDADFRDQAGYPSTPCPPPMKPNHYQSPRKTSVHFHRRLHTAASVTEDKAIGSKSEESVINALSDGNRNCKKIEVIFRRVLLQFIYRLVAPAMINRMIIGSSIIDGAGWKIVENVEGLIVLGGSTLLMLLFCVFEEISAAH